MQFALRARTASTASSPDVSAIASASARAAASSSLMPWRW
jgi:hypothetical protein